jgi:hypothetical protein
VYKAEDKRTGKMVGLKLLECDDESMDDIQKEIKILQGVRLTIIVIITITIIIITITIIIIIIIITTIIRV